MGNIMMQGGKAALYHLQVIKSSLVRSAEQISFLSPSSRLQMVSPETPENLHEVLASPFSSCMAWSHGFGLALAASSVCPSPSDVYGTIAILAMIK